MSPSRSHRRRGFTLVEALVGTAIMATLSLGVFHVFRSINRQASQGAWYSAAQKQVRNGLKRINDELSKASIYTRITPSSIELILPNGTTTTDEANHEANYAVQVNTSSEASGDVKTYTPNGGDQLLVSWLQCAPERTGFSDAEENVDGFAAACAVTLSGETLVFSRAHQQGDAAQVVEQTIELVENVESVETTYLERAAAPDDALERGTEITLSVTVHHPNTEVFPNTKLTQTITARVPVIRAVLP